MDTTAETRIYCDGLCEPNPGGLATFGYVIEQKDGARWHEVHHNGGVAEEGPKATNNVAEYTAAIEALRWLSGLGYSGSVTLYSDSQLLVNQLAGKWKVKSATLRPLWTEARDLMKGFNDAKAFWIPREENEPADRLSVDAYVATLEEERAEISTDVSVVRQRPGLYLAAGKYQVNTRARTCRCTDFRRLNSGRFSIRCEHLIAAQRAERQQEPVR